MKRLVLLALLAAAPAQAADCRQVTQIAGFKREVARACGYFVNPGEIEELARACARKLGPRERLTQERIGAGTFKSVQQRMGLLPACRDVLRRMRSGFVAD